MQHDARVQANSGLIPSPDVLTCSSPRVLWIELNPASGDTRWLEPFIRHTKDLESVRFCHDGESEEPGSLLRLIRTAHDAGRQVELVSSLEGFPVTRMAELVDCGLDVLTVRISAREDGLWNTLRDRLAALCHRRRALASETPAVTFILDITEDTIAVLPSIVRAADEFAVEQITLNPDSPAGKVHPITQGVLASIRAEYSGVHIDSSSCEDDPALPLNAWPRFTARPISGRERVFSCIESPWDSVRLLANGDVTTCALRRDEIIGNVRRQPIAEIWQSQALEDFRARYQFGTDPACRLCPHKRAYVPEGIRAAVNPQEGNTIELVEGWHWSEGKIIWSKPRSRCLVGLGPRADNPAERCLEMDGLLPGGAGAANILNVWHRGRKLGSFQNSSGTLQSFRLTLPFTQSSEFAQLEFTTSRVYRPRRSGSMDRRDLGFALVSLRTAVAPSQRLPWWSYLPLHLALDWGQRLARLFRRRPGARCQLPAWRPGITVIIPECGTPELLRLALSSAVAATARLNEETEMIVVVNGASLELYEPHQRDFPRVRWIHSHKPLGYGGAVAHGVQRARFDWVYLLNSDMTIAEDALTAVARWRMPHVFAISSQVFWADPKRRREETGWTNYSINESGEVELFDALPEDQSTVRGHLYAGGGNSLFRTTLLRRFLSRSHSYNPAYWEDVEWGVKAWRAGFEVLFCPESHVVHIHRATVSRLFSQTEVERIWQRNQLLFSLRNGFARSPSRELIRHLRSTLDAKTQRELSTVRLAASLFLSLWENAGAPAPDVDLARTCRKYYFHSPAPTGTRQTVLIVSPFAVYPPGHGGARRTASLIEQLSDSFDIVLLTDEESELRLECFARARGPASVHLTGGRPQSTLACGRIARIHTHSHERLRVEMERLALAYQVALIQIEHVELAALISNSRNPAAHVIDLHDVLQSEGLPTEEDQFEQKLVAQYDAVLTCSPEDAGLLAHKRLAVVPNGFTRPPGSYTPSRGSRAILFAGPFRFEPNLSGIIAFLQQVYPVLLRDVPGVRLTILGGKGSRSVAALHACFGQPEITIVEDAVEMEPWLRQCAVTINPVPETRGSCVKVIESIGFGRVCVCTAPGARGFRDLRAHSLITVPEVRDFLTPLRQLLLDEDYRVALEHPHDPLLADVTWQNIGRQLLVKYQQWFGIGLADGAADID